MEHLWYEEEEKFQNTFELIYFLSKWINRIMGI